MESRFKIPAPCTDRTVGTQRESASREWKYRCKQRSRVGSKSPTQGEAVMRSELIVAKRVSQLPRKAAIVLYGPVPQTDTGR